MLEALALLILVGAGTPIALVILQGSRAVFASAVVTAVLATIAGMLHVATAIPITFAWLALLVASYAPIAAVPRLRRRALKNVRVGLTRTDALELALVGAVVIVAVALVPAPLGWDARSIWLFHASWLNAPSAAFFDGQALAATSFSHPNYPILGPAAIAVVWGLLGGTENLVLGVQVVVLLSVVVTALGASILVARFGRGVSHLVTSLAFFAYLTTCLVIASGVVALGYMDPLQAGFIATLVATLMAFIARRPTWSHVALTATIAIGAISVKQEGLPFALAALSVYLVVSAREQYVRKYVPLVAVLGVYGVWKAFLVFTKSDDTSDASGIGARIPELFDLSSEAWTIIIRLIGHEFLGITLVAFLAALILLAAAAVARRSARTVQQVLLVALVPVGVSAIVLLTYALGETRDQIDWWLATSFARVIATTQMLSWLGVFFAVLLLSPWRLPAPRRDAANC